jgi:hypothetical protein
VTFYNKTYRYRYYYSEEEIDFTNERIDLTQFLLQEFFNADLATRKKLSDYYIKSYGTRAFGYLRRKYSEWANGNYHLTETMRDRILSFMPLFLTKQARHKIGIHEYVASIKKTVKEFDRKYAPSGNKKKTNINPMELELLFKSELKRVEDIKLPYFEFNVLTDEEKFEVTNIIKLILKTKLHNIFRQIERDFSIFQPYITELKNISKKITYTINKFSVVIDFKINEIPNLKFGGVEGAWFAESSKYKKYAEKYLVYELISINTNQKKAEINSLLNENDLTVFLKYYNELISNDSEVKMSSLFQGEGGELSVEIEFKTPLYLKKLVVISSLKLLVSAIVGVLYLLALDYFKYSPWTILISFYVVPFSIVFVTEELKSLSSTLKSLSNYGRQQPTS